MDHPAPTAPDELDTIFDGLDIYRLPTMPQEARERFQLKGMSHTHDMVINWMIANPEKLLRECADYFGYTQPWLSTLIHTDLFQARLKERQDYVFNLVASDVPAKLTGLSSLAVDKLGEALEKSQDSKFILDSFDKIMHKAGYAPASQKNPGGSAPHTQINMFTVSKETLAQARQGMYNFGTPVQIEEGQVVENATGNAS